MFEAIGFDPKVLTNEQLFDKQIDLAQKRIQATRFGKPDAANQLQIMIQMIERERYERIFNERIGSVLVNSSAIVVESDPSLQVKPSVEDEKKQAHTQPPPRSYPKPVRTSTPVSRDKLD